MSRRTQIGLYSFVLSLIWTAGLFAAFVGGRAGQHPSPSIALATTGAFCAAVSGVMLTLASFPGFAEFLRPVAQVAGIGAALDTAALFWAEQPYSERVPDVLNHLEFSNFLLLPSMVALMASGVLFFVRWFSNQASRFRFEPMGGVQAMFLLYRRHHRLLGWLALAFAAPHSVYFLLFPGQTFVQWTGIAATALLIVVGLIGLITSYSTFVRLWSHRIIAILVVIATGLHWFQFVPATTGLFLGICVAGLVNLKLVSVLARLSRASAHPG